MRIIMTLTTIGCISFLLTRSRTSSGYLGWAALFYCDTPEPSIYLFCSKFRDFEVWMLC